jgi:hypothetical protein
MLVGKLQDGSFVTLTPGDFLPRPFFPESVPLMSSTVSEGVSVSTPVTKKLNIRRLIVCFVVIVFIVVCFVCYTFSHTEIKIYYWHG